MISAIFKKTSNQYELFHNFQLGIYEPRVCPHKYTKTININDISTGLYIVWWPISPTPKRILHMKLTNVNTYICILEIGIKWIIFIHWWWDNNKNLVTDVTCRCGHGVINMGLHPDSGGGGRVEWNTSWRRQRNRGERLLLGIFDTPAGSGWCPASFRTDRTHFTTVTCTRVCRLRTTCSVRYRDDDDPFRCTFVQHVKFVKRRDCVEQIRLWD